jgi:hypothetical protein
VTISEANKENPNNDSILELEFSYFDFKNDDTNNQTEKILLQLPFQDVEALIDELRLQCEEQHCTHCEFFVIE